MAEYLIQDTTLTAIGDAIRAQDGTSDQIPVADIASRIAAIKTGVTVHRKSGTFNTNSSGNATVKCGFQPDLVVIFGGVVEEYGNYYSASAPFYEDTRNNRLNMSMWHTDSDTYATIDMYITQTNTGFEIKMENVKWDSQYEAVSNGTFKYTAVKYT